MVSEVLNQLFENFNSEQQRDFMDLLDHKIRSNYNQRIEEQMIKMEELKRSFDAYNNKHPMPLKAGY